MVIAGLTSPKGELGFAFEVDASVEDAADGGVGDTAIGAHL